MTLDVEQVSSRDFRFHMGVYVEDVILNGKRLLVTNHGRPRYAIVTVADLERLEKLDRKKRNSQSG